MDIQPLEQRLFDGQVSDLAEAAFIASGVAGEAELEHYLSLFEGLLSQIPPEVYQGDNTAKLKRLFEWLWRSKPRRYRQGSSFRLPDVLEAQLDPCVAEVGNCLGLTLLYNALAQRLVMRMQAVYLEAAFWGLPHVLSRYRIGGTAIDIEHILPNGFDYGGHRANPLRVEWDDQGLLADIYHSRGNLLFEERRFEEATELYDKALGLNPEYSKARLNKGLALMQLGRTEEAAKLLGESP